MSESSGTEVSASAPTEPVDAVGGVWRKRGAALAGWIGRVLKWPGLPGYSAIALLLTAYFDYNYVVGYGPTVTTESILAESTGFLAFFNAYAAVESSITGDKIAAAIDMIAKSRNPASFDDVTGSHESEGPSEPPIPPPGATGLVDLPTLNTPPVDEETSR